MDIKWNEYTWYSKLAAVIFFLAIFPAWTFYLGMQYQKTVDVLENVPTDSVALKLNTLNTAEKYYVAKPERCSVIDYVCKAGEEPFTDAQGCGCKSLK